MERKKRGKKIAIAAVIVGVVVLAAAGILLKDHILPGEDYSRYQEYVGSWQQEGSDDVENKGGARLEILSVDEANMVISFGIYAGGGVYNGVEVSNVTAVIEDGQATYAFADDGYGNSGKGTLIFQDNAIQWKSKINKEDVKTYKLLRVVSAEQDTAAENMEE